MGVLRDLAKSNSKFLRINKHETVTAFYKDFTVIPNPQDPDTKVVQYRFNNDGKNQYWTNGSPKVMEFFDTLPTNTWVSITRNPKIKNDGTEDATKSTYIVDVLNTVGGPVPGLNAPILQKPFSSPLNSQPVEEVEKDIVWEE